MTVPVALAVVGICLAALALLTAPQASRLLRPGTPPPRPRRVWVTLLAAREIGTGGAAAAAAWAALASGRMPAWAAAAAAGAAAYLVAETVAPALGLAMPEGFADWLGDGIDRLLAALRRPLERPAVLLATWLAGESGLAPASVLRFAADGAVEEDEEAALDALGRELLGRLRTFQQRPVRAVMTPRVRIVALPVDLPGPALLAALYEHRFSRLPVYRGDRDNVIGVLYAKDLCGLDVAAPGARLGLRAPRRRARGAGVLRAGGARPFRSPAAGPRAGPARTLAAPPGACARGARRRPLAARHPPARARRAPRQRRRRRTARHAAAARRLARGASPARTARRLGGGPGGADRPLRRQERARRARAARRRLRRAGHGPRRRRR